MVCHNYLDAAFVYPCIRVIFFIADFSLIKTDSFLDLGFKSCWICRRLHFDFVYEPYSPSGNAGVAKGSFVHHGSDFRFVEDQTSE